VPRPLTHHPYTDYAPYVIPTRPGPECVPGGAPSPRVRKSEFHLIPASTLNPSSAPGGPSEAVQHP